MSRRIYVLVLGGVILVGSAATFYWSGFARVTPPEHSIFKHLDAACSGKYGEPYGFRRNQCCDKTAPDLCAPL